MPLRCRSQRNLKHEGGRPVPSEPSWPGLDPTPCFISSGPPSYPLRAKMSPASQLTPHPDPGKHTGQDAEDHSLGWVDAQDGT